MDGSMSYTGRDIIDIRKALVNKIPELTDKWRDFSESDLGMVILELIAGAQDMQNFYFDNQAFETYLDTAEQDKNIRALLRTMNYRIPLKVSAKGEVRLEYRDNTTRTIRIPKYFQFGCSTSNYKYVVMEEVYRPTENGCIDIPVWEGDYKELTVTRKTLASNVNAAGNVSRRIYIGNTDVADHSIEICQDGAVWEEVDDAILEYSGGYVFSVHRDAAGDVYILMSVNFMDLIPKGDNSSITIKYLISHGKSGIVDKNVIDTILDYTTGDLYYQELLYISNTTKTYGAADDIDLSKAKILARRQAQTMGRYITLDDYGVAVSSEPYIKYSVVKDWKTKDLVEEPYKIKVWAVDMNGCNLGSQDKAALVKKLEEKGVSSVDVEVVDAEILDFDIHVQVILRTSSVDEAQKISNEIWQGLNEYYCIERLGFGDRVSISLMHSRVMEMSSYVRDVNIITPNADIEPSIIQFPKLGKITVDVVEKFE